MTSPLVAEPRPAVMAGEPLTDSCARLWSARAHACLGISPFNGHFTAERIHALARWALAAFEEVHFFVPDVPAAYTLEALGYPPERAAWKARRQGQYLRNKITRALANLDVADPGSRILGWQELCANPAYAELHAQVQHRFATDPSFAVACLDASNWVLERHLPAGQAPSPDQLRCAVRYFLAELPLFLDTPRIAAVDSSLFCYHQAPDVLLALYQQRLALHPAPTQGFLRLSPERMTGRPR